MTTSNALFTTPFGHNTDFTDLADNCQRYCEALVEETNPARKIALCGRLASTFALLRPMLLELSLSTYRNVSPSIGFPNVSLYSTPNPTSSAATARKLPNC